LDVIFGGRIRSLDGDRGRIELTFLDAAGNPITFADPLGTAQPLTKAVTNTSNTTDRWELAGDRVALPTGTRKIVFRFVADQSNYITNYDGAGSNDGYLDAAFLRLASRNAAPDAGAYGNTSADWAAVNPAPHIALRFPELYTDWERDKPHTIRWETFNNPAGSAVRIDLYQDGPDGPALLTTIAASTPDDGKYIWIPSTSGIDFGTYGLRIQLSLVGHPAVIDRSTETFTVPEDGHQYYVNDSSTIK